MRNLTRCTAASRVTSLLTGAMAVAALASVHSRHDTAGYVLVLIGLTGAGFALAALKMWWDNCFESRFVASVLALATLAWQALVVTAGSPADPHPHWGTDHTALVLLAAAVLGTIALDGRRRSRHGQERPPYAL